MSDETTSNANNQPSENSADVTLDVGVSDHLVWLIVASFIGCAAWEVFRQTFTFFGENK